MIDSILQALCDEMADTIRIQRAVIEPMIANLVRVVDDVARQQQAYKLVNRRPAREAGMMLLYRREPAVRPCRHEIREPVRRKIGF